MLCLSPITLTKHKVGGTTARPVVPCGKCAACLKSRRDDWSVRLIEECKSHMDVSFVTLTYADGKLNFIGSVPTVSKLDIQLFFKKLRKYVKCRYYCVSEYGPNTNRPHYHIILFGVSKEKHKIIQQCWSNGNIMIDDINIQRIRYVAKYHVNKGTFPVGASPPFALMSRKPGLGSNYLSKMKDYHSESITRSFYQLNSKKVHLPRFYREKLYSKEQRLIIASMFNDTTYSEKTIKEFNENYPNDNYFQHKMNEINNIILQFKQKSKLNQKL